MFERLSSSPARVARRFASRFTKTLNYPAGEEVRPEISFF